MQSLRAEDGVVPVVAVVLLVGITVALAAWVAVEDPAGLRKNLEHEASAPVPDTGLFAIHDDEYVLEPLGPDAVPLESSRIVVTADGVVSEHELAELAEQLPPGVDVWRPGQQVCIAGPAPECLVPAADEVSVRLVSGGSVVDELPLL